MPHVRPVLDFAADALPVLLEGVVTHHQRLQAKAPPGISYLLAAQHPDPPVDVLARDRGLDLLDSEKVLIVERAQSFEPILELLEFVIELVGAHCVQPPASGVIFRLSKHTGTSQSLNPKYSWPAPLSGLGSVKVMISRSSTYQRSVLPSLRSILK